MYQGKTLVELAQAVEAQQQKQRDLVVDTRSLRLDGEDPSKLFIDGAAHHVSDVAHRQIGQTLKVRADFYDRLRADHPDLLAYNVNTLLHREPSERLIRTYAEPQGDMSGLARAILSNRYHRIDNFQVMGTALAAVQNLDTEVVPGSMEVTERKLYLKLIFPGIENDVQVGDTVRSGVIITNSEIGYGAFQVAPFVERLVCLNGMVVNDMRNRRNHVGSKLSTGEDGAVAELYRDDTIEADDNALMLKMRDVIRGCATREGFEKVVAKMRESTEDKITGNPVKAVEVLADKSGLNQGESAGVMRHLIEGGDLSRWGMLNAVTRAAHDEEVVNDYDRATDLETLGGKILDLPRQDWKVIAEAA